MPKKKYYLLRTLQIGILVVVCTFIGYQLIMLRSTANKIKYQQSERFSYSLANLASAEATRFLSENKTKDLQLLIDNVSDDPLVRDVTIYDHLGKALYQSEDVVSLPTLLNINDDEDKDIQGIVPYMTELYKDNTKLGYIRISLNQGEILSLISDYQERSKSTMYLLIISSFVAGIIFTILFSRKVMLNYYSVIRVISRLKRKR